MRILLTGLIVAHALLHVLGFLKSWGLAELPALSGKTLFPLSPWLARLMGLGWLLAALVLLAAAGLRLARHDGWWVAGAAGLVLSQLLIILQWHDAKAGTLANVVIAGALALAIMDLRFRQQVIDQFQLLLGRGGASAQHDSERKAG